MEYEILDFNFNYMAYPGYKVGLGGIGKKKKKKFSRVNERRHKRKSKVTVAFMGMGVMRVELVMKSIVLVVMAGVLGYV